jgi:hypothetical protein
MQDPAIAVKRNPPFASQEERWLWLDPGCSLSACSTALAAAASANVVSVWCAAV